MHFGALLVVKSTTFLFIKNKTVMNILFDGNYLIWKTFSIWSTYYQDRRALPNENERRLREALTDKEKRQVFIRKVVIDACMAINRFKDVKRVAFVIDSHSWRYRFYENYKYSLTRVRAPYYKEFIELIDEVGRFLTKKGFIVSRVMGAEGDDLLYTWSIYFSEVLEEELVIITGDSDIRQIINPKVSLFCNNSKNLKFFCHPSREVDWNEYFDADIIVETVKPFEIVLYKVIMGDRSDNIPKIKHGFGEAAFKKFTAFVSLSEEPENVPLLTMAEWIADKFCIFVKNVSYEETLGKVLFNLKMTWLNLSVYNEQNFLFENGKSLLQNMLDNIDLNKDRYSYGKAFTLEEIYGSMIK